MHEGRETWSLWIHTPRTDNGQAHRQQKVDGKHHDFTVLLQNNRGPSSYLNIHSRPSGYNFARYSLARTLSYRTLLTEALPTLETIKAHPETVVHRGDAVDFHQPVFATSSLVRMAPLTAARPCCHPFATPFSDNPTFPPLLLFPHLTLKLTATVVAVEVATAHGAAGAQQGSIGCDLHAAGADSRAGVRMYCLSC